MLRQYFSVGDGVILGLLNAVLSFADRCWRATFQERAWRWSQEQHVFHPGNARKHHVEVEPPLVITCALTALRLIAGTIIGHLITNSLALRSCGCQVVRMREHRSDAFHAMCSRR